MKVVSASDLKDYRTLITNFMCDGSTNMKTYSDLVDVFEKCYRKFDDTNDTSNDLRILKFEAVMKAREWDGDVVLTQDKATLLITDGIHRGIAYLRCVDAGVDSKILPRLIINEKDVFNDSRS